MDKKIVLFDFDGVFVDTFELGYSLTAHFFPGTTPEDYRRMFERNINEAVGQRKNIREVTDEEWFGKYSPQMMKLPMVPGMAEVVKGLEGKHSLIIISSTISSPIKEYLEQNGLASHFTEIMGNDVHRSKVEKIRMVFDKYDASPADCVFITDTLGDVNEAAQCGVKSIGVDWGFHPRETLEQGLPLSMVNEPEEITSIVEKFFS